VLFALLAVPWALIFGLLSTHLWIIFFREERELLMLVTVTTGLIVWPWLGIQFGARVRPGQLALTMPTIVCNLFGSIAAVLAALWTVAGAGIYGSPLYEGWSIDFDKHALTLAFLFFGPFTAYFASLATLWKPKRGGFWLIVGAMVSGVLSLPYLMTDAFVFPLLFISLPMGLLGR
jgi:hypothetical protein